MPACGFLQKQQSGWTPDRAGEGAGPGETWTLTVPGQATSSGTRRQWPSGQAGAQLSGPQGLPSLPLESQLLGTL